MDKGMELVPYNLEAATIEALKTKYLDVTIQPDDKAAYAMVMAGLRECREIRLAVDGWHKERKENIVKAGKHYDSERRRVHALIEPIEGHLSAVRKVEDDRKEEIKTRAEREENARIENLQRLEAERLEKIRQEQEAERKRMEAAQREAEAAARKEREALDAERRKIEAEKKAIEDFKRAERERQERAEFERKVQAAAKARAEVEAHEKVEREAREKAEREAAEVKTKELKAAQASDKEKLIDYANQLEMIRIPRPTFQSDAANTIFADALHALKTVVQRIRKGADKL